VELLQRLVTNLVHAELTIASIVARSLWLLVVIWTTARRTISHEGGGWWSPPSSSPKCCLPSEARWRSTSILRSDAPPVA
jgi:hypothetical protein